MDNINILQDVTELSEVAAERWAEISQQAIAQRERCDVALAGGSTPRTLYQLLATPAWRTRIDWSRTRIWFGDERCVPPDHPDSNYLMARSALLDPLGLTATQVFRIEGEREPRVAAEAYQELLQREFRPAAGTAPRLDLLLLGLGPDGHIASLFPETPLLDETQAWVGACRVDKLDAWRISLTYPVLNAARHTLMLVAGDNKADVIRVLREGDGQTPSGRTPWPVERLRPAGRFEWLLDSAAAGAATGDPR